jgi:transcriptional regulator with XRE-family HTH domain
MINYIKPIRSGQIEDHWSIMIKDPTAVVIGNNLREARIDRRLTQVGVAELIDKKPNYYSKLERGEARPSLKTLEKLVEVLKVHSSKILPF